VVNSRLLTVNVTSCNRVRVVKSGPTTVRISFDNQSKSRKISRAVGDTLLAFMLLSGGPFDTNNAMLELDNRPMGEYNQCAF